MKSTRTIICSLILAACPLASALAGLGGDTSSVDADRASLKGTVRVSPAKGFEVHEINTPDGLRVHEYLGPQGKVFAVSWRGAGIPDLRQMLGNYYSGYAQAASAQHYNHHHLSVRSADVVVESSGHTRSFFGRAWVPALLPQSFSPEEIN